MLLIDWDMAVTLTGSSLVGTAAIPPEFTGTLRTAVQKAATWPTEIDPTIMLDGKVNGKTILGRSEINALAKQLNP